MPTNGNAGAALAAYAARAGMRAYVFCPDDTPAVNVREIALQGAHVCLVNGLINDCGRIVGEGKEKAGWFDVSTLKEPYRIEGKKTMGLELAEQLGWDVPDVILYPDRRRHRPDRHVEGVRRAGGDRLDRRRSARAWSRCRPTGCAPIVKAYEARRRARARCGRTRTRSPPASACRSRSATS